MFLFVFRPKNETEMDLYERNETIPVIVNVHIPVNILPDLKQITVFPNLNLTNLVKYFFN